MNNRKDRTILNNWKVTGELASFILDQEGLTCMDDWGGKGVVREILPEYMKTNFDMVQPELIDVILKEKNRETARSFTRAMIDYSNWANEELDAGKLACYHYFPISVEILMAMDVVPLCYEVLGGLTAALYVDGCEDGVDDLEAEGYPDHLCSTQKGTAGYFLQGTTPKPDLLIKTSSPCDGSNRLYEWTAHKFKAPLVVMETPYYRNDRGHRWMVDEVKRMIEELEKITGNTLDEDKLRKYCELGNQTMDCYLKTQELKKLKPCPDTGWHRSADTIFLTQIGTPMSAAYFTDLYKQVKERVDKGISIIPEGMKETRVAYGYTWQTYDLPVYDWLEEQFGVTYITDTLTYFPPDVGLVDTTSFESMVESLAWRTLQMPMGRQVMGFSDIWINDFVNIIKTYKADALVLGGHMACKHYWAMNKMLSDKVKEETGVPTMRYEMDMFDKRFTPPAELKRLYTEFFTTSGLLE